MWIRGHELQMWLECTKELKKSERTMLYMVWVSVLEILKLDPSPPDVFLYPIESNVTKFSKVSNNFKVIPWESQNLTQDLHQDLSANSSS